ncbi:hypothetical protein NZZ21_001474 [Escherichia albertii]|uniref:hypothetical protein n=1 Tax=Escherichia albertii TaxID=208962 RepID=UPI000CF6680D|nr:hypothetical protein [Escherichia albertii]EFB5188747.1 hypothetical protein [Escherichia albertii]EJQ6145869.1 hypothetical protein [Escherichia albertii]MCZ9127451.1 hypothetical protein [Escherichia albertii]
MFDFELKQRKEKKTDILIISRRDDVSEYIKNNIETYSTDTCDILSESIFDLSSIDNISKYSRVIIDIESESSFAKIIERVKKTIPLKLTKFCIGDTDSIVLYNDLIRFDIKYLYVKERDYSIYKKLQSSSKIERDHNNLSQTRIAIIGCKGGSGTSTISFDVFLKLQKLSSVPVLIRQKQGGGEDLDIISNNSQLLSGELYSTHNGCAMKMRSSAKDFSISEDESFFNLVIDDYSLPSLELFSLREALLNYNLIIIITNDNISSIRKAKEVIELITQINVDNSERKVSYFTIFNSFKQSGKNNVDVDYVDELLHGEELFVLDMKKKTDYEKRIKMVAMKILGERTDDETHLSNIKYFFRSLLRR